MIVFKNEYCGKHEMGPGHPESPERVDVILNMIKNNKWNNKLLVSNSYPCDYDILTKTHCPEYVDYLISKIPKKGYSNIAPDLDFNLFTFRSALFACGATVACAILALMRKTDNYFCAVRPPGHHAETNKSMGFCVFNNIAVAVNYVLDNGIERVAILDFDVHHCNGTAEIFKDNPNVLVCSSFQNNIYPNRYTKERVDNYCFTPLKEKTNGDLYRLEVEKRWEKALKNHQPEIIFVSAGFDAHIDDPIGGLELNNSDFIWIAEFIKNLASIHNCSIISSLEGGYNLKVLSECVENYLKIMIK